MCCSMRGVFAASTGAALQLFLEKQIESPRDDESEVPARVRVSQQIASQFELLLETGVRGKLNAVTLGGDRVDALARARFGAG